MYDIDRYYKEKIFVKFDTKEEFEQFCDETEEYAEVNKLFFFEGWYREKYYYTASWRNNGEKKLSHLGFQYTADINFIAALDGWILINAKELEVRSFDAGQMLEFIGGY
mgnify:CR=1 FL=1